jgi:hypothetical protein
MALAAVFLGVITMQGREIAATPDEHEATANDLFRALSGLAFGELRATGGNAGEISLDLMSAAYPIGSLHAGRVEASYVDRARFGGTLAAIDTVFFCGGHVPILGQTYYACPPSHVGLGGTLGDVMWEPATDHLRARWGELRLVLDLLGEGNTMAYLHRHVDVSFGAAAESDWAMTAAHAGRGVVAITALARSCDAHWEANATGEARPALLGTPTGVDVLARTALLYHVLVGEHTVLSGGLDARYARDAFGRGVFVGATVELRHESPR